MNSKRHFKKIKNLDDLTVVHPHAAGLDIGAREIWVCAPPQSAEENVRVFGTFTPDLRALADWLLACGVTTIALESTGVYWLPVFEMLEARGLQAYLVNAWHLRHVPGRKSDVLDCQWIQKLHSLGLLRGSFRPDAEMRTLRTYLRHRAGLIQHRAPHILHMQKALLQMNIQLSQALSDVTGQTGQAIIRAIVTGERDPQKLASLRDRNCKKSEEEIGKALTGTWREEYLFILRQSLELYDYYTRQIEACDAEIARTYALTRPDWEAGELKPLSRRKRNSHSKTCAEPVEAMRRPIRKKSAPT